MQGAPPIVGPNKDPSLALIIVTTLMPSLLFMVMKIISLWMISFIATLMIAFVIAIAPPPPLLAALADDAVGGVVPLLLLSLLWYSY
jgi:hypothetical protein